MSPQNLIPYLQYRNPTNTRLNRQIILTKNWSRALVLLSSKAKRPLDLCKQTGINKIEDTRRQSLGETKLRSCLCLCTHVHVLWTCTCVCQSTSVCVCMRGSWRSTLVLFLQWVFWDIVSLAWAGWSASPRETPASSLVLGFTRACPHTGASFCGWRPGPHACMSSHLPSPLEAPWVKTQKKHVCTFCSGRQVENK